MGTGGGKSEVRLALVFNGGVSLAVWMGGVTHEIDLLRRARSDKPDPSAAGEYWRDLCAKLDVEVLVDIVAGTSAGGLNGALLASAVAAGESLPADLRRLWIEEAALTDDKMLKPQDEPESLFNGEFFEKQIEAVVVDGGPPLNNGAPVTLFITATGLGGRRTEGTDAVGNTFAFDDHRRLYRFAYDRHRYHMDESGNLAKSGEDGFDADGRAALVRAARATASFPLAFAPVCEEPLLPAERRRQYRAVPASATAQPAVMLMDGGVLDNAPFRPVLEEIARRPVNGPYRRVLGYVVPSSTLPEIAIRRKPSPAPIRWNDVLVRALSLPREADFRDDVEKIDATLAVASESARRRLHLRLINGEKPERDKLLAIANGLGPYYRRARAAGAVWRVRRALSTRPLHVSLGCPRPVRVDAVLGGGARCWLPPEGFQITDPVGGEWPWGVAAAEHVVLMLLRDAQDELCPSTQAMQSTPALDLAKPGELAGKLCDALAQIHAVEEAVDRELVAEGVERDPSPEELADDEIADLLDSVFGKLSVRAQLGKIVDDAATEYAERVRWDNERISVRDVMTCALAAEVLSRSFADPTADKPPPPMEFVRIGPDAQSPCPELADYNGGGGSRLFGSEAHHFGAFTSEYGRKHDWLWGRLDAVARLTRLLMPTSTTPADVDEWIVRGQRAVLADEARLWNLDSGKALTDELGKDRGSVLIGQDIVEAVGGSAVRLLTSGEPRRQWQQLVEALVAVEKPTDIAGLNRVLRWVTRGLRKRFWRYLTKMAAGTS